MRRRRLGFNEPPPLRYLDDEDLYDPEDTFGFDGPPEEDW